MLITATESPPEHPEIAPTEIVFHQCPAIIVSVDAKGHAKMLAFLSGFDVETADVAEAKHLARALTMAAECVDLLNSRKNVGD